MNDAVFRTVRGDSEAKLTEKRSTFIAAVRRVLPAAGGYAGGSAVDIRAAA